MADYIPAVDVRYDESNPVNDFLERYPTRENLTDTRCPSYGMRPTKGKLQCSRAPGHPGIHVAYNYHPQTVNRTIKVTAYWVREA